MSGRSAGMDAMKRFTRFATAVARTAGRPQTFALCLVLVVVWAVSGPVFKFSDTWQLVINTGTTIVTFLMVFLIQNTQNREGAAMQAKLDEIIEALPKADASFVGIEHLTDDELEAILRACEARAKKARSRRRPPASPVEPAKRARAPRKPAA